MNIVHKPTSIVLHPENIEDAFFLGRFFCFFKHLTINEIISVENKRFPEFDGIEIPDDALLNLIKDYTNALENQSEAHLEV